MTANIDRCWRAKSLGLVIMYFPTKFEATGKRSRSYFKNKSEVKLPLHRIGAECQTSVLSDRKMATKLKQQLCFSVVVQIREILHKEGQLSAFLDNQRNQPSNIWCNRLHTSRMSNKETCRHSAVSDPVIYAFSYSQVNVQFLLLIIPSHSLTTTQGQILVHNFTFFWYNA